MKLNELKEKFLFQMTGEEFLYLNQRQQTISEEQAPKETDTNKRYVYGLAGIAELFGCSIPTANRLKQSRKLDLAITQVGRKIIVDAELALKLAKKKTGGRKIP